MFIDYALTMYIDRLVGGIPRHPELVKRWQEAKFPESQARLEAGDPKTAEEATDRTVEALGAQALEEEAEKVWTGFIEADGFLAIESRQIKAMLKESANIIRTMVRLPNQRSNTPPPLRARVAERVFVTPNKVVLSVREPTGTVERPIHVMTQQGPRTALKRTDYVDDAEIRAKLRVLDDGLITEDILRMILDHASLNGIGTDRSQGNGTFTYKLEALDGTDTAAA